MSSDRAPPGPALEGALVEPGFFHLGPREWAAVLLAVVIIVDWAALRYGSGRGRSASRA